MTWYVILLYSAVRRIYVPGMYSCIQSAAAAAAAAALCAAILPLLLLLLLLAAAACYCCLLLLFVIVCRMTKIVAGKLNLIPVFFFFIQTRFFFYVRVGSTVAFTVPICLLYYFEVYSYYILGTAAKPYLYTI